MAATLTELASKESSRNASRTACREGGSLICFVRDPDEYRIELIERSGK